MRTCGGCGARLADGATWCSLCFAPVTDGADAAADTGAEAGADAVAEAGAEAGTEAGTDAGAATSSVDVESGPAPAPDAPTVAATVAEPPVPPAAGGAGWSDTGRRIGDHVLLVDGDARGWRCALCATEHPIEDPRCGVCGTSLFSAVQRDEERRSVPVRTAALWSIVPGGGQWVVGLHLQAPARFATVTLALAASFTFPTAGPFLVGRLLFVVIGVALWVVAGSDACAVAAGRAPLLTDRRLLWTSAGLLGLLVVTAMVGVVIGVTARV